MSMSATLGYLLTASMLVSGGQAVGRADINWDAIPVITYDERVEGSNAITMADTPDKVSFYVPDTGWKENEMEAPEEECEFTLVDASSSVEEEAAQFMEGQSDSLALSAGEYVVIELDGAHWISDTTVEYSGRGTVELWITDGSGAKKYQTDQLLQAGSVTYEPRTLCTYLKVLCPSGSDAIKINRLEVSGIPTLYEQILRQLPEDKEVLGARDEENTVGIYRIPLKESIYRLADALLAGTTGLTDHEKIMVCMEFVADFYVGSDVHSSNELGCQTYIGACGGYSNLLAALANTQGIRARLLTLGNYPVNDGHAVCEVYYDDAWHLYDPTYGAYYTSTPVDNASPEVLSYADLSAGAGDDPDITCVVITPSRLTSAASYGFLGPAIYEKANPKGVLDSATPMHYPLTIVYTGTETIIHKTQFDASRQGITTLGVAYINYLQDWTIDGLTPGQQYQFIVTADFVGGEIGGDFQARVIADHATIVQNETHIFNNASPESMEWVIEFIAQADTVQLLLSHGYQGPDYHYISLQSFAIDEK